MGCASQHPDRPGLPAGTGPARTDTHVLGTWGSVCVPVEPSLPWREEGGSGMGLLAPAPGGDSRSCRQAVPSEQGPSLGVWPGCRVESWAQRRPLLASVTGVCQRAGAHLLPLPKPRLCLLSPSRAGPKMATWFSRGFPRGARGRSPPGARLPAGMPGRCWNGIPSVPGRARGVGILPALSLASAGELVTWPRA